MSIHPIISSGPLWCYYVITGFKKRFFFFDSQVAGFTLSSDTVNAFLIMYQHFFPGYTCWMVYSSWLGTSPLLTLQTRFLLCSWSSCIGNRSSACFQHVIAGSIFPICSELPFGASLWFDILSTPYDCRRLSSNFIFFFLCSFFITYNFYFSFFCIQ